MMRLAVAAMSLVVGAGVVGAGATAPADAAGGASGWSEMRMEQTACIAAGRRAVTQLGFDASNDDQTVFGWQGLHLVAVRCIASKTVAVFFSYMDTEPEARNIIERLRPFFEQAAGTPAQPGGGKAPEPAPAPAPGK